jgi:hypothetical protein
LSASKKRDYAIFATQNVTNDDLTCEKSKVFVQTKNPERAPNINTKTKIEVTMRPTLGRVASTMFSYVFSFEASLDFNLKLLVNPHFLYKHHPNRIDTQYSNNYQTQQAHSYASRFESTRDGQNARTQNLASQ